MSHELSLNREINYMRLLTHLLSVCLSVYLYVCVLRTHIYTTQLYIKIIYPLHLKPLVCLLEEDR